MSPAWSPDGQSLAYVSFESKNSAIYVQVLRTGERRRVSARQGINGAPAWSPDGSKLAITLSRKDGDVDIYTLELATQVLTRMTFDPGIDTEPAFSADGRKLYFTSDRSGGPQI
jgi:TolB protein